jgi:hypothetical protein
MFLKLTSVFIIIGILFSYTPIVHGEGCPKEGSSKNMKMDCGYIFHCPFLSDRIIYLPFSLPFIGRLVLIPILPNVDELTHLIFHPPEYELKNFNSWRMKEKHLVMRLWEIKYKIL